MSNNAAKGVAMITGASAGIGAAYADRLAARGYDLLLVARRPERLHALAERFAKEYGSKVYVEVADITRDADLARLEGILRERQDIELFVNNAGAGVFGPTSSVDVDRLLGLIQLNVVSMTRLSLAALAGFRTRNRGSLINVGSSAALDPVDQSAVYCGTKAFTMNFTRSLQREYGGSPIRIQLTLPGAVRTEFVEAAGLDSSVWDNFDYLTPRQHVDAAMAGFDQGELVTIPSLLDQSLWEQYDSGRNEIFQASQVGKVADRYL